MLKDFRDFVMRGNLVELAVAVIIATALTALVKSLIDNVIMPIIASFGGTPDFRDLTFTVNGTVYRYGQFLTDLVSFLILAAVVYFVIVRPYLKIQERMKRGKGDEEVPPTSEDLLTEIRDLLAARDARER